MSKLNEKVPRWGRSPLTGLKYRAQKAGRVLGQCQGLPSADTAVLGDFNLQDYRGSCRTSLAF